MKIQVILKMNCSYTNALIEEVLEKEREQFQLAESGKILYWMEYEDLDFDMIYKNNRENNGEKEILVNSFCIRKALLRKANFAAFIEKYLRKRTDSQLKVHYPETHILDLSHPDYLEEALNEAFELRDALEKNENENSQRIPFILKASILDKASELFLFYTQKQLEEYFVNAYEQDETIGDIREWIVQRYIDKPKLLSTCDNRKFHLRVYVVAQGNLRVFVYDGILALFASLIYENPDEDRLNPHRHVTNTCAQLVSNFDENYLVKELSTIEEFRENHNELYSLIFQQIQTIVREIFTGLHHEITVFQPLKNAFEIYGFDFLIDEQNQVFFLEANAFPDFKQTGGSLKVLIRELFENVLHEIVLPYFTGEKRSVETVRRLHLVYDQQKSN